MQDDAIRIKTVHGYHRRTKHSFGGYAASPGKLDWATQPDPFRTYHGCARLGLALAADNLKASYADLYQPHAITAQELNISTLAAMLELSFGLSAWKQYGSSRWALRCNPSSGNLHPTEVYIVAAGCPGLDDGVHHYVSRDHALEQRCAFAPGTVLPRHGILVGLASIHWREAWKYGERAYRYCQHDVGHAVAALSYAAAALGWRTHLLAGWSDADLAAVLGLERSADFENAEREHPDLMLFVSADVGSALPVPEPLLAAAGAGSWSGQANALSPYHAHDWPIIETVAEAATKPRTSETAHVARALPAPLATPCTLSAPHVFRQRRSAQAFDGATGLQAQAFFRMLDVTLPRPGLPPWNSMPWPPAIHLALFVHRVEGVESGLYLFLRDAGAATRVRAMLSPDFEWSPVAGATAHLPLWRLASGDARAAARTLSCHQDIAADGAFSLGMLADYERALDEGAWNYRRLYWEAGMIGQVLYLEAEAAGVRGTGIGCYFDDPVHEVLGLRNAPLQSLYHFTVGRPVDDQRLTTLAPYAHLVQ